MKTRLLILLVSLFALTLPTTAQDDIGYLLRTMDADEYLTHILPIIDELPKGGGYTNYAFLETVNTLLFRRYPNLYEEDFDTLLKAYYGIGIGHEFYGRDEWNRTLVHAWLRQNSIDLSNVTTLNFADYEITVIPYDFDADGQSEYVLDVIKGAIEPIDRADCNYPAQYVDYFVIRQHSGGYEFIDTPFRWYSSPGSGPTRSGQGGLEEIEFEDINADGLPEWILASNGGSGGGPAMGYFNYGELYVVGWRHDRLVHLTPQYNPEVFNPDESLVYFKPSGGGCLTQPLDVSWELLNTDDDSALEISQHQLFRDNWYCETRETKSFDWSQIDDRYVFTGLTHSFVHDTRNCAQRQAEEAMWEGDYETAIAHFERGLLLDQYEEISPEGIDTDYAARLKEQLNRELLELDQYMRVRLALAYILVGQNQKADDSLKQLAGEEIAQEPIAHFVTALRTNSINPIMACAAAYDVYTQYYPEHFYGLTYEQRYGDYAPSYMPNRIGCDAPKMILDAFATTEFKPTESPLPQMETLGLDIEKTLHADLNGDGVEEWLVWLRSLMPPLFFVSDNDTYKITQAMVDPYQKLDEISILPLPNYAGQAVAYMSKDYFLQQAPWFAVYDPWATGMGGGDFKSCITEGRDNSNGFVQVWLWAMKGNELRLIFNEWVCRDNPDELTSEDINVLDGGAMRISPEDGITAPYTVDLKFHWNDASGTFVAPPKPTTVPQATTAIEPKYPSEHAAFVVGDYQAYIAMTDNALSEYAQPEGMDYLMGRLYLRAFAFESLNRPDDALAQYVAIYEAGPESAWGRLAALHLERVDE